MKYLFISIGYHESSDCPARQDENGVRKVCEGVEAISYGMTPAVRRESGVAALPGSFVGDHGFRRMKPYDPPQGDS